MKNTPLISSSHSTANKMNFNNHHKRVPKAKMSTGSLAGMYPVILDDGRTIIYTSDKDKEAEIRLKYAMRK